MEEKLHAHPEDDLIDLGQYWAVLRPNLWKVFLLSLAVGIATFLLMLQKPNIYQATAVITPVVEERQNQALGALTSFGLSVGGPTKVQDLEALFKSNDLAVRVFLGHDFWSVVLPDSYDTKTGKMKVGWLSSLLDNNAIPKPPGEWTAIGAAKTGLKVLADKKTGILTLSFESVSKEGSANIVKYFLEEAKSRLQEEAFNRATKNKMFIEEQISRTVDALNRDRLYSLLGQEVEREMMARNREQFGFRVIDSPRVPIRKVRPQRGKIAMAMTLLTFLFATMVIARFRHHQWMKKFGVITRDYDRQDRK